MELRAVKYFVAVAEAGSVTGGAEHVRISQPAVSRQLVGLEREVGTPLFTRGHGAVQLTHAGRRFLPMARDLLRRESLAREVLGRRSVEDLRLTVVAQQTTILRTLAPFTAAHGAGHPILDAVEAAPAQVYETVRSIGADIGVSTIAPPADWASKRVASVGLSAHVPSEHPLAEHEAVEVADLVRYPLILMERTHTSRTSFEAAVTRSGTTVDNPAVMSSSALAQAAAAAGRGAAVLTDAPAYGLHSVRVVHQGGRVGMPLYAAWDRDHYAGGHIAHWVAEYADWLPELEDIVDVAPL